MFRSGADSDKAVTSFFKRSLRSGAVWVIDDNGNMAGCNSTHDEQKWVIAVFSDEAYAKRGAKCWDNLPVTSISLDSFVADFLLQFAEDGVLLGPNWDSNMAGREIEAQEMISRFKVN